LDQLEAIPKQLEQSNIEAKSLQDLRSRLDRLEGSVSMQSSKAQKEEEVRKKLVERLENLEVSSTRAMLQPRLDGFEAATLRMSKEVHSLQSRLERLDQDFARHFARLEDLEQERREGQMLEEVLQDKVGRIERLEAAVKGDARSISSVRDEIARLGSTEDGKQERLRHLETQLAALERWRKDDAQVRLTRCDQQIQTFTQLAEESAQSPLISEAAKFHSEELKELKVELGRVSALAERSAEKSEVTEVSRCLQNSIASAQESMSSIKDELLQVQHLAGVARDGSPRREAQQKISGGNPSEPLTWTSTPRVVNDVARLAEELHQARSAAMHQTRMEVHRAEAIGALEFQVAALNLRLEEVFARLNEVELGIDTTGRGGVALRLRFEQMQSSVELRLTSLAADMADVCTRQHAMERGLKNEVREPLQADLWERTRRMR